MRYRGVWKLSLLVAWMSVVVGPTPAVAQAPRQGERYAFLVGVKTYLPTELRNLECSENDVTELAEVLKASGYRPENIRLLTQAEGNKNPRFLPLAKNLRDELHELVRARSEADSVIVAFAGHGVQFKNSEESYFCPADARLNDTSTLVPLATVYDELKQCKASFKLLLVDACRNDPFAESTRDAAEKKLESLSRPPRKQLPGGVATLFSCSAGEKAFEDKDINHGVFFHFVIEGLKGAAAPESAREVTLPLLENYVQQGVKDYVAGKFGSAQTPERDGRTRGSVALVSLDSLRGKLSTRPGVVATLQERVTLKGNPGYAMRLVYSPDGKKLATLNAVGPDGGATLWDTASGEDVQTFKGAIAVAFTPDGRTLALGLSAGLKLVDATSGNVLADWKQDSYVLRQVGLSPDGKWVACSTRGSIRGIDRSVGMVYLYDIATKRGPAILQDRSGSPEYISVLEFAPNSKLLATGHMDGTVKLWDLATGQPRWAVATGPSPDAVLFTSDSKTLVTVNKGDSVARLWDVATGKRTAVVNVETPALAAALVRTGRLDVLATVGQDGTLKLWNLETQKQQTAPLKLSKDKAFPLALAVSPDGRSLAASLSEMAPMEFALRQVVRLWNLPTHLHASK